ncbi:hypothetical protein [Sphingomonas sp.]|jgi:hypothetical protein|uniref:hypothetical protein n=1 Tax=Sphingomonas sp. TaxID=28214 RepID=UPI002D7F3155|nr:hypothetical protein [Sphingomonas sp.]HEU0043476.1 hypothetical protein [Sphingomonas sp.]
MKTFKALFATAAAAAMLTATTAAAAPQAAGQGSVTRAATSQANASDIGADVPFSTVINIGILAALVVIVLLATRGGDNDSPTSP